MLKKKFLVLAIIGCFVGASVVPSISSVKAIDETYVEEKSSDNINYWSLFTHK